MASLEKNIAGIIPGMMSLGLVGKSSKMAKDSLSGKSKEGDFIKTSIDVLVGVPLIGAVATSVGGLS